MQSLREFRQAIVLGQVDPNGSPLVKFLEGFFRARGTFKSLGGSSNATSGTTRPLTTATKTGRATGHLFPRELRIIWRDCQQFDAVAGC